ncbi:transporter [Flavobacterium chuncheonense]|uniref:Transporter n=1 Tax=Flavobacterium chuncheonense TaxID=2026653 RepID=A0ABW5YLS1_9FLAO
MKYFIYFLICCSTVFAKENDTLALTNPFKNFHTLLEDCDACGCSASGGSMGFSSMINPNFIGVRYFYQSYKSNDGLYSNSPWYDENFNTIQAWGRIPISEKIQVSLLVPYHFHNRDSKTGNQSISGIGDITALGFYTLIKTKKDSTAIKQHLMLGSGVKMPSGSYNESNNGSINPSYQQGTGSWDYLIATEYTIKRNNIGLNTMLNYTFKTENEKNYQFGNQLNYGSTLFYTLNNEQISFVPQIGIAGEVYESNYQHGQRVRNTAGDILFGKIGIEIGKNRFSFGANTMLPVNQNLTGGNVQAQYRWSINLNYSL